MENAKAASFHGDSYSFVESSMDELQWDEELFDGWKEQGSFIAGYLQSIAEDGFRNHTIYCSK